MRRRTEQPSRQPGSSLVAIAALLWTSTITGCWTAGLRAARSPGATTPHFVTSNRLGDSSRGPAASPTGTRRSLQGDYNTLLEMVHGDFGVKSAVVNAAEAEPEYKGSATLVVPLYIPEGAVPIRLARIARSGAAFTKSDHSNAPSRASSRRGVRVPPSVTNRRQGGPRRSASNPTPPPSYLRGWGRRIAPRADSRLGLHDDSEPSATQALQTSDREVIRRKKNQNSRASHYQEESADGDSDSPSVVAPRARSTSTTTTATPTSTTTETTTTKAQSTTSIKIPNNLLDDVDQEDDSSSLAPKTSLLSNGTLRIPVVNLRSTTAPPLQPTTTSTVRISTDKSDDHEANTRSSQSNRERRPMTLPRPVQDILGQSVRLTRTKTTSTTTTSTTTTAATTTSSRTTTTTETPPPPPDDEDVENSETESKSVRTGPRIPLLLRSRTSQSLRTTEEPPASEASHPPTDSSVQSSKPSNHIVNTRRLPFPPRPSQSPSTAPGETNQKSPFVVNDSISRFRLPLNSRKHFPGTDDVDSDVVDEFNSSLAVTDDSVLSTDAKSTSVVTPSPALSVSIPVRRRRPLRTRLPYVETSPKYEPNFSALDTRPTTAGPLTSSTTSITTRKLPPHKTSTPSTAASSSSTTTATTTTTTTTTSIPTTTSTATSTTTTPAPESTGSPSTTTTSTVRRIHEFFKISPYRNVQKTTARTEVDETKLATTKSSTKTSATTPASLLYPTSHFWHKNSPGPKFTSTQKSPNIPTPTRRLVEFSTPSRKLPNQATTPIPAAKSPADIVLDSLSEVMRDATTGDKDRYREIATDLDILNKQLAERGILIIHAEIDGKIIKLRNQTKGPSYDVSLAGGLDKRPSYDRGSENFNESELESVLSQSLSSTDDSITTIFTPSDKLEYGLVLKNDDDLIGSHDAGLSATYYNVRNKDDLTEKVNTISKGKVVKVPSHTTSKPSTKTERVHSSSVTNATSSEISIENLRNSMSSILRTRKVNRQQPDRVNSSMVSTRQSSLDSENDAGSMGGIPSSTSFTNPVTTRTRTTVVPVTETFELKTARFNDVESDATGTDPVDSSRENDDDRRTTLIKPSSHVRPLVGNVPAEVILEPSPSADNNLNGSHQRPSSSRVPTNTNSEEEELLVIEEFLIEENAAGDLSASSSNNLDENPSVTPDTDSDGASSVYLVGMVGIFPLAGVAAYIVRRFLRGEAQQKALPESEERPDGFTPPTHHHPRPHSLLPDVPEPKLSSPPSSETGPTPSLPTPTPWEFSRSKLRFVSVLGEGNFGVVWKAEARGFGDFAAGEVLVAVKMVKDNAGPKEKCDLLRELSVMQQLGPHQNVVSLLGCCTQTEPHLVIMEYIMFGKLLTFLRDHRLRHNYFNFSSDTAALTSRDLTRFACQVANGCEYLQTRGIIHRDLAARNILVDHNKLCKIADFGMARSLQDMDSEIYEQKSKGAQPVRWMAPESLCLSIFTHKSDVWSFGILCWEIVTLGATPYPGLSAREVMCQVTKGYRLERPEHCRPELYRLLAKCWHYDVNKRPTFHQLNMELNTLLEHHTGYIDLENFPEEDYFSMHQNNDEKL